MELYYQISVGTVVELFTFATLFPRKFDTPTHPICVT